MKMLDLPPVWTLGFVFLAWAQDRLLPVGQGAWDNGHNLGVALILASVALVIASALQFRRHRTTIIPGRDADALITDGVYRLSRNPIYLADVMLLAGVILLLQAWPSVILVPILVVVLRKRFIEPEEARLASMFVSEFARYTQQTRRWL